MKKFFQPKLNQTIESSSVSVGLLLFRIMMGVAFMMHGFGKIQAPFSWMGPEAPVPSIFQGLAALAEFGGGLALILGLLMPLANLGLIVTMIVAAGFHISKGDAFFGGYELALVYLFANVMLLLTGPGKFSLDKILFLKLK